jgi:lipoprotein signal peptidase
MHVLVVIKLKPYFWIVPKGLCTFIDRFLHAEVLLLIYVYHLEYGRHNSLKLDNFRMFNKYICISYFRVEWSYEEQGAEENIWTEKR